MDQRIDLVLAVARLATLNKVRHLLSLEATRRVGHVEGPQERIDVLEIGADSEEFVHHVFDADDAEFAQGLLDDLIIGDGDALLVHFGESALVDERAHALEVGVAPGNVRADPL